MKPQETMLEQGRLNGKGGFVTSASHPAKRHQGFVEGTPVPADAGHA